jgi:hypothetical protein
VFESRLEIVRQTEERIKFSDMFKTALNDASIKTIEHPYYIKQPIAISEKVSD